MHSIWFFFSADIRNLTEKIWSAINDTGTCCYCYFTQHYLRNTNFDWFKSLNIFGKLDLAPKWVVTDVGVVAEHS